MPLPANFSGMPTAELHRYFRNSLIEFKKVVKSSTNIDQLQDEMERFLNASKELDWHHKNPQAYRKDEAVKATDKVWAEFKRYVMGLQSNPHKVSPQDLIDALSIVEQMVLSMKVT